MKRVQEALAAAERREQTEFSGTSSSAKTGSMEGIEMQELGKRTAVQPEDS